MTIFYEKRALNVEFLVKLIGVSQMLIETSIAGSIVIDFTDQFELNQTVSVRMSLSARKTPNSKGFNYQIKSQPLQRRILILE